MTLRWRHGVRNRASTSSISFSFGLQFLLPQMFSCRPRSFVRRLSLASPPESSFPLTPLASLLHPTVALYRTRKMLCPLHADRESKRKPKQPPAFTSLVATYPAVDAPPSTTSRSSPSHSPVCVFHLGSHYRLGAPPLPSPFPMVMGRSPNHGFDDVWYLPPHDDLGFRLP